MINIMKFSLHSIYKYYKFLIRNTKYNWWVILGTLVYFVSPLDFSPDFFPIVGKIDDFFILSLLITELTRRIFKECRDLSRGIKNHQKKKRLKLT